MNGHPFKINPNTPIRGLFSLQTRLRTARVTPAKEQIKTSTNQNMKVIDPTMKIP